MKKFLSLAVALCLMLTAMPAVFAEGAAATLDDVVALLNVEYAKTVTTTISELGDNPDIGNRSCGSAAEKQAAEYIQAQLTEIGLDNVTVDEFTTDTWSFNRGRVWYTDESGAEQYIVLGGFATNLTMDADVEVVYAGYGTMEEYEGLDVNGKVVLIDINQAEDWWVEIPVYEAYTRGAIATLVCNVDGYAYWDDDTIGSQDICGPAFAPAFALSMNARNTLLEIMEANDGIANVRLDVDSVVSTGTSQNVWAEIPGQTDEVIYFFAHYDGYYHSFFDDAEGVGTVLALAKAFKESGYTPDKTLRFVLHGAEEWGHTDTEYDWSTGAYFQITKIHPEWADNAYAILNLDGMYPTEGHTSFNLASVDELTAFTETVIPYIEDYGIKVTPVAFTSAWTEDFSYIRAGVPSIVASHAEPEEIYHGPAYHSNMDNIVLGVNDNTWEMVLKLFSAMAVALDETAVRPMEFTSHVKAMEETYAGAAEIDFESFYTAAAPVDEKIAALNADYAAALAAGDTETAAALRAEGIALDTQLHEVYDFITDSFLTFDYEDNTIYPFEMNEWNIEALNEAIALLTDGDGATAYDEVLYNIDYNWYAYSFSEETYAYMLDKMNNKTEGTWGEGMIRYAGENLWSVIHSVESKLDTEDADYSEEIAVLQTALERQLGIQTEIEAQFAADLATAAAMLTAIAG